MTAPVSTDRVRELNALPVRELIARVEQWGRSNGRRWVVGGPRTWRRDELVSALLRIDRGEEP